MILLVKKAILPPIAPSNGFDWEKMENVDDYSIILAVIIWNFGILENALCAETDQIWLRIGFWNISNQIGQAIQLRCCLSKSCIQEK